MLAGDEAARETWQAQERSAMRGVMEAAQKLLSTPPFSPLVPAAQQLIRSADAAEGIKRSAGQG